LSFHCFFKLIFGSINNLLIFFAVCCECCANLEPAMLAQGAAGLFHECAKVAGFALTTRPELHALVEDGNARVMDALLGIGLRAGEHLELPIMGLNGQSINKLGERMADRFARVVLARGAEQLFGWESGAAVLRDTVATGDPLAHLLIQCLLGALNLWVLF
jgi:hypothetical protein